MGVPLISETNKNKELLLEIDSIVPDTNGHHLADISLSSNDSLSRSRRRWKLIKIISKMNPSFQGKSKKLIFYQSLSAILSMILTGIMIYWLVKLQSTQNSSELLPSSSSLVSSQSQSQSQSQSSSSSLSPSSSTQSPPPTPEPPITLGWPGNFEPADYETFSAMDNPVMRLTDNSNNTDGDGVETLKVTDSISDKSGEDGEEKSEDEDNTLRKFQPPLPFPPFQSFPQNWFQGPFNGPLFLPPFFPPSPPSQPPFQMMDPFESDESSNPITDQFFDHFTPPTFNLAKIKSSAQKLHASAVGALDELMKKLKGSGSLVDFLVTNNEDDQMDPELVVRSEDDQDTSDLMETFNDTDQLDDTVDNLFNLIKKIVF